MTPTRDVLGPALRSPDREGVRDRLIPERS